MQFLLRLVVFFFGKYIRIHIFLSIFSQYLLLSKTKGGLEGELHQLTELIFKRRCINELSIGGDSPIAESESDEQELFESEFESLLLK
jgi:hypothetical protein